MCPVVTPSVLQHYFGQSLKESVKHAELVAKKKKGAKDLTYQADGALVSLGRGGFLLLPK